MRYFRDENDPCIIITEKELRQEYEALFLSKETESESFEDYLTNCLDKNGTLEEIWKCSECGVFPHVDDDHIINPNTESERHECSICQEYNECANCKEVRCESCGSIVDISLITQWNLSNGDINGVCPCCWSLIFDEQGE